MEDFVCSHCGSEVKGNGYTNHCPKCLWSRHVDVNPGDRASDCKGMMKPVRAEYLHGAYTITYRCERCRAEKRNKASEQDDKELLLQLATK
jgi:DNA-directed RNA polymerase subunit RPC12/RpoP